MQSKEKNGKSICPEIKIDEVVPIPAIVIAELADVSESLVKKIDAGIKTTTNGKKSKKVAIARALMDAAVKHSQQEVKRYISEMK